jgi:hypothetical protein
MGEPLGEKKKKIKGLTFLFWFRVCKVGCEGPKVVLLFSLAWVVHQHMFFFKNLEVHFCFLKLSTFFMTSLLFFHVILFFFVMLFLLCCVVLERERDTHTHTHTKERVVCLV